MDQTMHRTGNFLPRVDEAEGPRNEVDRHVVSLTAPASVAAEQYRTLYYRLERMREVRPMKVITLSSALPGEGKTVTAVNLALTAARANLDRRILLVDADLRASQVAQILGLRSRPGLSEFLQDECQFEDAVRRFRMTRLTALPSGAIPEQPGPLLAGQKMKELLKAVRENFDEVYVDLPPSLPFADAAILAPQTDGLLMVVRAGVTSSRQVALAIEHLAGVAVLGCVLNGAEGSAAPYLRKNYAR